VEITEAAFSDVGAQAEARLSMIPGVTPYGVIGLMGCISWGGGHNAPLPQAICLSPRCGEGVHEAITAGDEDGRGEWQMRRGDNSDKFYNSYKTYDSYKTCDSDKTYDSYKYYMWRGGDIGGG
jgi:hypothetical protein